MSTTPPLPPQPPYTPVPPPPPLPQIAAPPPPDKVAGGSVVKIILIIVGVFVFLGILGAAVVGYGFYKVSHAVGTAVKVDKDGGVSINTPGGTISTAKSGSSLSTADLGTDVYPGATRGEGSMNIKTPQGSMVSAIYTTGDSVPQVVDFYKSKLGESASTVETGSGTMLTNGDSDPNNKVLITVTTDDGKTKINIVHTTKKADTQ